MKYFFIRTQLVFVSVILLLTMGLVMVLVTRNNYRWDFTREKAFSLAAPTENLLRRLGEQEVEVLAFYPQDDPARSYFEVFLKECKIKHPKFKYDFYDPDRMPKLAKEYRIRRHYTVLLKSGGHQERVVNPSEEAFTNALYRLANPKKMDVCFVTGHEESPVGREDRTGLSLFRQYLLDNNYSVHEIIVLRDKIPAQCTVLAVMGPHRDLDPEEFNLLKQAVNNGRGVLFLIDPMDPGTGKSFRTFLHEFGVVLGEDVIVDKMSRQVGGDFLVPLVSQYVTDHPITGKFNQATFFPVVRSVQPSTDVIKDLEVVPLALTNSGSWAERNLAQLEKGEASFDPATDLIGPIPAAVAVEKMEVPPAGGEARPVLGQPAREGSSAGGEEAKKFSGGPPEEAGLARFSGGRMVVVGDSDFLTNAYLTLSGNRDLGMNMIQWLAKDDRFISVHSEPPHFQPLLLNRKRRLFLFGSSVALLPLLALIFGCIRLSLRRRSP